ncbi:hypothetical protein AYM39_05975 [Methylomonas sp. DH-1]|nr:hypothetical protein AYM39_05975 [Methylomonas sp. DH-1]
MESLRVQLDSVTGSAKDGASAFDFLTKFATDTPFEIDGLTKAFVSLKNYGIQPTAEVMQAITDQSSKLGASQETLSGIVTAFGQAWAKGKLQAEEMMQLAERGVPVYDLLSRSLGVSTDAIQDMAKSGDLTRDTIRGLIAEMGNAATGSNARAMDTLNGKISNLSDAWHQFEDTLLNDKSEGLIKSIIQSETNSLNILKRNLSSSLDDQIAHAEARINQFNQMGAVGRMIADYSGYDIGREQNKLDALRRKKSAQDELDRLTDIKNRSRDAVKETQSWLDELEALDLAANKKSSDKSAKDKESAAKSLQSAYESTERSLRKEIALRGENSAAAQMEFEVQFGSLAKLDEARALILLNLAAEKDAVLANVQAYKEYDDVVEQGLALAGKQRAAQSETYNRLFDRFNPGYSSLTQGIADVDQAKALGLIDADRAKAEFDKLGQDYNDLVNNVNAGSDEMSQFAIQASRNIQTSFADFIMSAGEGFDELGANFAKTLARMAADAASAQLMDTLLGKGFGTDKAAGNGLLQAGFSALTSLFGFADGGIMTSAGPLPLPDGRSIPVTMAGGGKAMTVIIHNYGGAELQTKETDTADGKILEVIIDKRINRWAANNKRQGGLLP